VDGGLWRDVGELVRSIGMVARPPAVRRLVREFVAVFDDVVAPVVVRAGRLEYLTDATYDVCAKLGLLLAAYAATARVPFRADLAMLGGAVARVYDDLVDGEDGDDDWATALFRGEPLAPRTDLERLLGDLYAELERRLGRDRDDPVYAELLALHDNQVRSRQQRDPAISPALLADITRAKGGHAMAVFAGLLHPAMNSAQLAAVRELGAVLQVLDDYLDVGADRLAGITTVATSGELTLAQVCRPMRALRPRLRACFDRDQPLSVVLYLTLWMAFLRRRSSGWPARNRPFRLLVRRARRLNNPSQIGVKSDQK
jgi:hypothetical protein